MKFLCITLLCGTTVVANQNKLEIPNKSTLTTHEKYLLQDKSKPDWAPASAKGLSFTFNMLGGGGFDIRQPVQANANWPESFVGDYEEFWGEPLELIFKDGDVAENCGGWRNFEDVKLADASIVYLGEISYRKLGKNSARITFRSYGAYYNSLVLLLKFNELNTAQGCLIGAVSASKNDPHNHISAYDFNIITDIKVRQLSKQQLLQIKPLSALQSSTLQEAKAKSDKNLQEQQKAIQAHAELYETPKSKHQKNSPKD